jgi:hypothetical protein
MSEQAVQPEVKTSMADELMRDVTPSVPVVDPIKDAFFRNELGVKYDENKIKNILKAGLERDESLKSLAKTNRAYLEDATFLDNVIKKGVQAQENVQFQAVKTFNEAEIVPQTRVDKKFTAEKAKKITDLISACKDPHSFVSAENVEELGNLVQEMHEFNMKDGFKTFNENMKSALGRQMALVKMKSVIGAKFFTNPKKREWHPGAVARSVI